MSISITDIRNIRINAMQNLRRGMTSAGKRFSQDTLTFPTGRGMSASQLESLYQYYEQFQGHRISPEEFKDIGLYKEPEVTEDEFLFEDFNYDDYDEEDIYDGSFIELAKDKVAGTGNDYAIRKFNDFIRMATESLDKDPNTARRKLDKFFSENMDAVDELANYVDYLEKNREKYGDHSTNYLASKSFESLNEVFFSWERRN